ncbi:MAG: ATP-binding cassette domain-containing protein [Candidatus Iainarchaeum archaeon]|uniref:ATP-binding cassette domain-containing protein n=1 Tax=Candidatus Iainarchaeum sp. TaxID=3101447 RepID=A0A7T9I2W2_9ARCH|nr:MAG: ATP-binding cassette domain-containing protein [Candidatus Diapherotrites archaeon]
MQAAIVLAGVTKKFGAFTAVNHVSLTIPQGEIFGLLGPNGAGKSTTLSMLATLSNPTHGNAEVWGFDTTTQKDEVRKNIGMVFQDYSLDDELTGFENMDFHGRLFGMTAEERGKRIHELLNLVDLGEKANNQVKTYSGGMKRRLEIARALLHVPKVLFLDEPTIGLDPQTRRKLWDYIAQINKSQGITIILTTHYMDEADALCSRIGIMDKGEIIALDSPQKLKAKLGGDIISLAINPSFHAPATAALSEEKFVREVKPFDHHLNVVVENGAYAIPKIMELAQKNKWHVDSVSVKEPTLEDVFIHFTGKSLREEEGDEKGRMRNMARMMGRR